MQTITLCEENLIANRHEVCYDEIKRDVWYPNLSIGMLKKLLTKVNLNHNDIELLKDYLWVIYNDKQFSLEKGFIVGVLGSDIDTTLSDPYLIVNIIHRIDEFHAK